MVFCKKCGNELNPESEYCPVCGTPTKEVELELASWVERFVAFLIDSIIVSVVVGIFPWPRYWKPIDFPFLDLGITNIFLFLYWTYFEGTFGQGFGKSLMRIRVVDLIGRPVRFNQSMYQAIGKSFLTPVDVLIGWILYPGRRQRLFNNLSDTIVVRE